VDEGEGDGAAMLDSAFKGRLMIDPANTTTSPATGDG